MRYLIISVLTFSLFACSSIDPKISKLDTKNYQANKDMAITTMKTWSLNSGFISGLGITSEVKFPITSAGQLRAIINSPAMVMALVDIDEVTKKRGFWSEEDFDYGFFLGARVRAGSQAAIQFVKDFLPDLMQYAPALFAL